MATYAAKTSVPSETTRMEIERTLTRYGAVDFMYGSTTGKAVVGFTAHDRQIRFTLPLPDRNAREFTHTKERGLERSANEKERAYEQAVRQRWRALLLIVKAKLEAVDAEIVTFEQEFLAHTVLPGNVTVYEATQEGIEQMYLTGRVGPLFAAIES